MPDQLKRVTLYGGPADGAVLDLPAEQCACRSPCRIPWQGRGGCKLLVDYRHSEPLTEQLGKDVFAYVGEIVVDTLAG